MWVLWWCFAVLGAGVSVAMAVITGEVRAIGDHSFWTAMVGIGTVFFASLPGFALYRLARQREEPNWRERWWRPSTWVGISLLVSLTAALWSGYLIAIRFAREWQI